MIMININTADSLVNGALGSIIDIVTKDGIDSEKVGTNSSIRNSGSTPPSMIFITQKN